MEVRRITDTSNTKPCKRVREQGRFYILFGAMSRATQLNLHVWLVRTHGLHDGFGRFHSCLEMIARLAPNGAGTRGAFFVAVSGLRCLRVASFFGGVLGTGGGGM